MVFFVNEFSDRLKTLSVLVENIKELGIKALYAIDVEQKLPDPRFAENVWPILA
tara:strand:+ start:1835 stop:1996 length:162 start_codon:yes stop_codon:yes gene_type:complete